MKLFYFCFVALTALSGCAIMHHTQIGEVDSNVVLNGRRFEILVSEFGFSLSEAADIAKALTRHKGTAQKIGEIQEILQWFQLGPKTGNPVFSDTYSDQIFSLIQKECPNGYISGLMSIRESAKYPVVSGEIVKLTGYCLNKKDG